jgi:hypothetical protein
MKLRDCEIRQMWGVSVAGILGMIDRLADRIPTPVPPSLLPRFMLPIDKSNTGIRVNDHSPIDFSSLSQAVCIS